MTSRDMLEYEAAMSIGMIPDWRELCQLLVATAGGDPHANEPQEEQDMSTLFERRRAMYGR